MGDVVTFPTIERGYERELPLAAGAEFDGFYSPFLPVPEESSAEVIEFPAGETPIINPDYLEFGPDKICVNVEQIGQLSEVRHSARQAANEIVETNRRLRNEGLFDQVHLDVDALGTVAEVDQIGQKYGKDSQEYLQARKGLHLDYARKLAEVFTKNTSEYFEPTVQVYDEEQDALFANGMNVDAMLERGLSPLAVSEELNRRINDYVFSATAKEILKSPAADQVALIHVMPCPDWALDSLKNNPKSAHGGYAPEVEKLMIGFDWFDSEKNQVIHEQIAVPGKLIDTEVINRFFELMRAKPEGEELSKQDIHATQLLADRQDVTCAMDVITMLDQIASEVHGVEVFLGEAVDQGFDKDYHTLYELSAKRKQGQTELKEELVTYVEGLYYEGFDHALATHMVEKYIQEKLLKIAEDKPEIAFHVFNQETAQKFSEAMILKHQGQFKLADSLLNEAKINAPPTGSCGAGSCGLEAVDLSGDEGKQLRQSLRAEAGDEIVKDTERACKCGKKSIVYAYNANKVNKYCTSCKSFESKQTKNGA